MSNKKIENLTELTTVADGDEMVINDISDSSEAKKLSWANIKATLKTYFDTLYVSLGAVGALTGTDHIVITPGTSKLVKLAVLRQDNTTNAYDNNTVILAGWGYIEGNGTKQLTEAVTFGITFSERPIVILHSLGYNSPAPTHVGGFTGYGATDFPGTTSPSITTTGFNAVLTNLGVNNLAAGSYYGYSWIAIGQLN